MTEKLYVIGHPVDHSKSPVMHNAAYQALGLDWNYGVVDCLTESEAQSFIETLDWLALNVTTPYKPLAFKKATWHTSDAQQARGANVLVHRGDDLFADNTDGKGCVTYLRRQGVRLEGARIVVCGTGPTSLAIVHAAARAGAELISLLGRDEARAQRMAEECRVSADHAGAADLVPVKGGSYASSRDAIEQADVIFDATPLGMRPGDPAPFDTDLLSAGQTVFDVVYGHQETALIAAARESGCTAFDGAGMLVAQAVHTVCDIVDWLDVDVNVDSVDLFSVMAQAAGFSAV